IDQTRQDQLLAVTFTDLAGVSQDRMQEFSFHYVNDLEPYVDSVRLRDSDTLFYSGIEVKISQESIELLVQTENEAKGVNLYMPDQSQNVVVSSKEKLGGSGSESSRSYYIIELNKTLQPEGRSNLRFVPFKETTAGEQIEFPVGAKQYLVNYNP